jgi:hypothetical protein
MPVYRTELRLPPALLDGLRALAADHDRSVAAETRVAIAEHIERHRQERGADAR